MIRYSLVGLAFAIAFFAAPARAQTPSEESLVIAREVVALTGGEATMRSMMETMRPALHADVRSRGVPDDIAVRYVNLYIEEFEKETPRILELTAVAYAGAFSLEQLREMRTFFGSETGRALSARGPELTAAMTRAGMMIGEEILPRVMQRLQNEPPPAPS